MTEEGSTELVATTQWPIKIPVDWRDRMDELAEGAGFYARSQWLLAILHPIVDGRVTVEFDASQRVASIAGTMIDDTAAELDEAASILKDVREFIEDAAARVAAISDRANSAIGGKHLKRPRRIVPVSDPPRMGRPKE